MVIYFWDFFLPLTCADKFCHPCLPNLRKISITAAQKRRIFRLRRSWAANFLPY
jgi:hypothetical protein